MPQAKTLFSTHYLEKRLPQHPEWDEDLEDAYAAARALWERAQQYGDNWDEAQTEEEFIKPLFELLGWHVIVQPKAHQAGHARRPDYALFPDPAARDAAYPHQGDDDAFYAGALAIAEAKYWQRPLSKSDKAGREAWDRSTNPSYQIVSYLVGTGVAWGLLTNGQTWRLYSREVSSTASEFYEVDLGEIFGEKGEERRENEGRRAGTLNSPSSILNSQFSIHHSQFSIPHSSFKRFWLFFRRAAFVPDARGRCFVQRVHEGSATYAREISDKLKELVYAEVMPEIAGGFIAYRREQLGVETETEESLAQVYEASLSLLYKLLFLLYAEARALLPVDNAGYREQSLTRMAQWAAERLDTNAPLSDATFATPKYDALLALFRRVDRGDPSLGIPRYDGGLFNPQNPDNQFLDSHRLSDRAVARAVDILVRDAGEPVDYAYISVRNLGAIYEGLLEFKLNIANDELRMMNDEFTIQNSKFEILLVNDKGERKATGSYYTPDYIVAYIVEHTLGPIVEARAEAFAEAMGRVDQVRRQLESTDNPGTVRVLREQWEAAEREAREAFLGIKVCDPAMGSGHFLVNAVDYLTDQVIRRMQAYHDAHPDVPWEWNPIQNLIERVREAILADMARQGIGVDPARLDDTALLTRLVMKRCIYGVDLNPMAVELAKLSLWLHSFTVGAPLSFLDHHLRCGNSLIGTDVRTVEAGIREDARGQFGLFQGPFAGLLDLTALMVEVVDRADATLSDVQRSAEDFATFQNALTPYKQVLDLWVSQHFSNANAEEFLRLFGENVLPALRGERDVAPKYQTTITRARELWAEKRFFHWDLEFPEVFVDLRKRDWAENPGFDAVVGNPPYVRVQRLAHKDTDYIFSKFETCSRKIDISLAFLEMGFKLLSANRLAGFISSSQWISTDYGQAARAFFGKGWIVRIVDFGSLSVFENVSTYPAIFILSSRRQDLLLYYEVDKLKQLSLDKLKQFKAIEKNYTYLDEKSWILKGMNLRALLSHSHLNDPLSNFGHFYIGALTGSDEVFVISDQDLQAHSLEEGLLLPYAYRAEEIEKYTRVKPAAKIIYPYRSSKKGEAQLIPEEELANSYPMTYAYLLSHKDKLSERRDSRRYYAKGENWYQFLRPGRYDYITPKKLIIRGIAQNSCVGQLNDNTAFNGANCPAFIQDQDRRKVHLSYLLSVLNSHLISEYLTQVCPAKLQGYTRFNANNLNEIPIRRINFTTPAEECTALLTQAIALYETLTLDVLRLTPDVSRLTPDISRLPFDDLLAFVDACLTHEPEQADVVHDLLAHLAEEMIALHKQRQKVERALDPFKFLNRGAAFVTFTKAFADALKYGERLAPPSASLDIDVAHHDIDGLRLVSDGEQWRLEAQLKLRDPADEWRSWQYEEGGNHIARVWVPVYRLPLDAARACYYEHALPVLGDFANAKSFPGGRTRTTLKKLQLARVPVFDTDIDLVPLVELSKELAEVQARITATDRLIDLIVYRLYGLTEEEVAVVEGTAK